MALDLNIEQWPVERLHPYEKNPRKNDHVVSRIVDVLRQFGFRIPVLAKSDGELIDGHLRYKAALAMGMESLPVILADDMTESQVRAFRIMVNRSATWADWDETLLAEELKALELSDLDIRFTGFDTEELERLLPRESVESSLQANDDEEEIPAPPVEPVSQAGDIWLLGDHALLCGNAGDQEAVAALMDGSLAKMCFTSPPYSKQRKYEGGLGDWDFMMRNVFSHVPLANDGQLLVNLGLVRKGSFVNRYWDGWINWMESNGWRLYDWYVWDQSSGLPGHYKGHLLPNHEWIFHLNKEATDCRKTVECKHAGELRCGSGFRTANGVVGKYSQDESIIQDMRVADSVIRIRRQVGRIGKDIDHPAVFPIALPEFIQSIWTDKGDIVFEPFCGSGSSIIAAQRNGRIVRAVEIAPAYVDVAIIRFHRLFPNIPVILKSDGKDLDAVSAMRRGIQ